MGARLRHSDPGAGVATTGDEALWHGLGKLRELGGATRGRSKPSSPSAARGRSRCASSGLSRPPWSSRSGSRHTRGSSASGTRASPEHPTARRVLRGYGSTVSFDLRGGAELADAVCRNVRLIRRATSPGAVESTMERRAAIPGQGRLPPSLLRVSVGIEHAEDLCADLDPAIRSAAG